MTGNREGRIDSYMYDNNLGEVRKVLNEACEALRRAVKKKIEGER